MANDRTLTILNAAAQQKVAAAGKSLQQAGVQHNTPSAPSAPSASATPSNTAPSNPTPSKGRSLGL